MYGIYTKEVADAIFQFYANQSKVGGITKKPDSSWQPLWYFVKLTEVLDAASDPETGYTQATANVVKYSNTADDLDMEEVTDTDLEITVTNRSTGYSGEVDDYLWVVQPYGIAEFIPLVSSAGGGGDYFWFTVVDLVCPGDDPYTFPDGGLIVSATYSSTGEAPVDDIGGVYHVIDYLGILDYSLDAVDNIVGSKGRASRGAAIGSSDFQWILDSIKVNPICS